MCAANPSLFFLTIEKVVCDGLRTISGSTMVGAAFSDALDGPDLAEAFGNLESYAGFVCDETCVTMMSHRGVTTSKRLPWQPFHLEVDAYYP